MVVFAGLIIAMRIFYVDRKQFRRRVFIADSLALKGFIVFLPPTNDQRSAAFKRIVEVIHLWQPATRYPSLRAQASFTNVEFVAEKRTPDVDTVIVEYALQMGSYRNVYFHHYTVVFFGYNLPNRVDDKSLTQKVLEWTAKTGIEAVRHFQGPIVFVYCRKWLEVAELNDLVDVVEHCRLR